MTGRIVILASGGGTNAQALIDATRTGRLDADIVAIITNRPTAGVIARGEAAGIEVRVIDHAGSDPAVRAAADRRLVECVTAFEPDLVVLAGWMRILGAEVGAAFPIINLHPAKPGEFAGVGAIRRAWEAFQQGTIVESGVMVHWVPDEGVDVGPVIVTEALAMHDGESLEDFEARVHTLEHRLIVEGASQALASRHSETE